MKILVISSFVESLILFRGDLIKQLLALGHDVHVVAPELDQDEKYKEILESMGVSIHPISLQRTGLNPFCDIMSLFTLYSLIRAVQPTHVLAYTIKPVIYGMLAAGWARVPTRVALITGLGYAFTEKIQGLRRFLQLILRYLYKRALCAATTVIFQNPDDLQLFAELCLVNMEKCHCVNGSGVNLDRFQKVRMPEDANSTHFLLIARLLKDKGICEYVSAARKVQEHYPEAKFHLVGWADTNPAAIDIEEINSWVNEGIIYYHGRMDDVRSAIEQSHVYVLPSYREGTPRTVLEAMAMGRPVITTDAPGCRETVIHGDNGFLVPIKAISELAEAMKRFIIEPNLITTMGNRGRFIAEEKFDVHKVNNVILQNMNLRDDKAS